MVVTARDPATLAPIVFKVEEVGATAVPMACDVREEDSVAALADAVAPLGRVHVVVANAGVAGPTAPMHEISLAQWRDCLATDLDGVFLTFRAIVPAMIAVGTGSPIAISSMTGKRPLTGRTPYSAAKLGVIGLARTLALELGPHGIRSARGTLAEPGRNVAQKAGLNRPSSARAGGVPARPRTQGALPRGGDRQGQPRVHQSAMRQLRAHRPGQSR